MAEEVKEVAAPVEKKSSFKFYRSHYHGLKVPVANENPENGDPNLIEYVRFQSIKEKYQGDDVIIGYCKTDNKRAIEVLSSDANVSEISEKEYNDAVKAKA